MCVRVAGTNGEDSKGAITAIGLDAIRGETEMCIMAVGLGQLIGKCVGRDKRTGRFVSLTKRTVIGAYTDVEPVEFERRPNPRKAPAIAARLIVGLTLAVVTAMVPKAAFAATIVALLLPAGVKAVCAVAGYVNREFAAQWRFALALAPAWALLVWLAIR